MTIQIPRKTVRGLSRRRFLSTAAATGVSAFAMPHLSRAADRPMLTHAVDPGNPLLSGTGVGRGRNRFPNCRSSIRLIGQHQSMQECRATARQTGDEDGPADRTRGDLRIRYARGLNREQIGQEPDNIPTRRTPPDDA